MKKIILSEEFKRMQKLAGIITEGQYKEKLNEEEIKYVTLEVLSSFNDFITYLITPLGKKGILTKMTSYVDDTRQFEIDGKFKEIARIDPFSSVDPRSGKGTKNNDSEHIFLKLFRNPNNKKLSWEMVVQNNKYASTGSEEGMIDKTPNDSYFESEEIGSKDNKNYFEIKKTA
jgi:hypothetical protein